MTLHLLRPGELPPSAEDMGARAISALAIPASSELPARAPGVALYGVVDAASAVPDAECRTATGEPARSLTNGHLLGCPNNPAQSAAEHAAALGMLRREVDGVLLDRPDAWYAAGHGGAGFCSHCEAQLHRALSISLPEQFIPGPLLPAIARELRAAPFWRERESARFHVAVRHGNQLALHIKDEARRERTLEMPVGAHLTGLSPVAVDLARRLDFAVLNGADPKPDRFGFGAYEVFRAALAPRPLTVVASDAVANQPGLLNQAARLASAVGAELSISGNAPTASHTALTQHRQYWRELRARYRPSERLAEVLIHYSSESDHWSQGTHGAAVLALTELLTRLSIQYRVVLEIPRSGSEPLLLPEAGFLNEEMAGRLERRINEGSGAIVIGACGTADETGRPLAGPFDLSDGLNRIGSGSIIRLSPPSNWDQGLDALLPALDKALESLLGRGRRLVSVSRPSVLVKMYLDPDRKLDVHLVGRQFDPATGAAEEVKGLVVHLAGSAVSGARAGYLFSQGEPERRVSLSAFGVGVQTTLPDFTGAAILSITR